MTNLFSSIRDLITGIGNRLNHFGNTVSDFLHNPVNTFGSIPFIRDFIGRRRDEGLGAIRRERDEHQRAFDEDTRVRGASRPASEGRRPLDLVPRVRIPEKLPWDRQPSVYPPLDNNNGFKQSWKDLLG